jgi:hypothetical protein
MFFLYRTSVSDDSEIPMSFPFPELPFPISFPIKNMKTVTVLVFSDRFRPFSSLDIRIFNSFNIQTIHHNNEKWKLTCLNPENVTM